MIRSHAIALGFALVALSAGGAFAAAPADQPVATDPAMAPPPHVGVINPTVQQTPAPAAVDAPSDPIAAALRDKLAALPTEGSAQEIKERAVLTDYYNASHAPLWVGAGGLTPKGGAVIAELMKAGDWGLDPGDFALPHIADAAMANLSPAEVADAEVAISLAVLKYARFARGGRIIDPTILLTSQFDRKPQLLDPEVVFAAIAAADAPDAYLRGVHPKQPQFEKLRQAYLANRGKPLAKKLLANMEEWRWMPDDLGAVHILANVPEFMVYLYKDDKVIHTERIVVGETGKQTTIFSRNLKTIVFKPMWRVPESIKVRELQPNLLRGGSMFRQYDLELQTKDGQTLDYRSIDWRTADIKQLRGGAAAGPQERDGRRQVHVPEPAHDLHARHRRQMDVRAIAAHAEPRLPAPAQPHEDGRARARRGQGLGRRQGRADDERRPAQQRDRHREEDPDAPRLLHGVGRR